MSRYIPAFPCQAKGTNGLPVAEFNEGMTLRDYLAGQALVGQCAYEGLETNERF